jgi:hypothetical protein
VLLLPVHVMRRAGDGEERLVLYAEICVQFAVGCKQIRFKIGRECAALIQTFSRSVSIIARLCSPAAPRRLLQRYLPDSNIGRPSFDHLVCAAEEREREGDAEGFGCLEVDKQLDFRDQLDRQISRLVALEYASGIDASLTV